MKRVSLRVGKNVTVQAEGESHLEVFEELQSLQEVFQDDVCGKCGNDDLMYRVRKPTNEKGTKEYKYPEIVCKKCWARLTFGQMEGGAVFPVRFKREDGQYVTDGEGKKIPFGSNGWVKYNKETGQEE